VITMSDIGRLAWCKLFERPGIIQSHGQHCNLGSMYVS
jgi:hypothetical protein